MNKKERYTASPWAMIYTDDNYYLLAYHDGKMKHFRVDRMEDVELRTVEQNGLKVIVPREGKEEYEMVIIEMGKDRKYRWYEVKPRYGENGKFVYMEIGGEVAE